MGAERGKREEEERRPVDDQPVCRMLFESVDGDRVLVAVHIEHVVFAWTSRTMNGPL